MYANTFIIDYNKLSKARHILIIEKVFWSIYICLIILLNYIQKHRKTTHFIELIL